MFFHFLSLCFSPIFSLAFFHSAPQLTERLEEAMFYPTRGKVHLKYWVGILGTVHLHKNQKKDPEMLLEI